MAGGRRGGADGPVDPYQRALGLLVRREHSRRDLARKLAQRGHDLFFRQFSQVQHFGRQMMPVHTVIKHFYFGQQWLFRIVFQHQCQFATAKLND